MLDQSLEARVSRAGIRFRWGFTMGLVARRMMIEGCTAEEVALEIKRQPDYIDRVRRDASDDLLRLALLEAEPEPELSPVEDRDAEGYVPQSDGEHAALLYDVRRSQSGGRSMAAPQPLEGDRDTVTARVETYEVCLCAVKSVKKSSGQLDGRAKKHHNSAEVVSLGATWHHF